MDKIKKHLVNLSLFTIFSVLTLFACEIISRIIMEVKIPYFVDASGKPTLVRVPSIKLRRVTKKNFKGRLISSEFENSIKTNSFGFRDNAEYRVKKNGNYRIFGLGDSFTFGYGVEVEETYLKVLEKKLQDSLKIPVETFNLGVIGYGTIQEIMLYHQFKEYKPDLIIMGFFARNAFSASGGNDLVDNYYFMELRKSRSKWKPKQHISTPRKIRNFLRHKSNLYRIVELYLGGYLRKNYKGKDNPELKRKAWEITENALIRFDEELKEQNIKCLLLWIPFPASVVSHDSSIPERIKSLHLDNIILVNPLGKLRVNPDDYYYKLDCHWNAKGHELAAQLLFETLIEQGIIEPGQTAEATLIMFQGQSN